RMQPFIDFSDQGRVSTIPHRGEPWIEPVLRIEFVWIDALSIWVGKHQVTNAQYRAFQPSHTSGEFRGYSLDTERQPAVRISFLAAMAFAEWLTRQNLERKALEQDMLFRVPSDREWTTFAR